MLAMPPSAVFSKFIVKKTILEKNNVEGSDTKRGIAINAA